MTPKKIDFVKNWHLAVTKHVKHHNVNAMGDYLVMTRDTVEAESVIGCMMNPEISIDSEKF